jgi:hypothetical protein
MLGGCGGSSLTHTDTVNTSKPLTDVTKDSHVFAPKHRGRESSPSGSDLIGTAAETAADNASIVDQHTLGKVNGKPKADAAEGEQKPADDSSTRKRIVVMFPVHIASTITICPSKPRDFAIAR